MQPQKVFVLREKGFQTGQKLQGNGNFFLFFKLNISYIILFFLLMKTTKYSVVVDKFGSHLGGSCWHSCLPFHENASSSATPACCVTLGGYASKYRRSQAATLTHTLHRNLFYVHFIRCFVIAKKKTVTNFCVFLRLNRVQCSVYTYKYTWPNTIFFVQMPSIYTVLYKAETLSSMCLNLALFQTVFSYFL